MSSPEQTAATDDLSYRRVGQSIGYHGYVLRTRAVAKVEKQALVGFRQSTIHHFGRVNNDYRCQPETARRFSDSSFQQALRGRKAGNEQPRICERLRCIQRDLSSALDVADSHAIFADADIQRSGHTPSQETNNLAHVGFSFRLS
jgi:hypothetical protein